ncbi:MAG: efflux RND transporter permease subunit [Bdellovibrionales bacterium]|nr:efflux RND transporter permease subunit [Bdellovibrionales bacterium]
MNYLINYFGKQGLFANLTALFVFLFGLIAVLTINREAFPNIKFDIVIITTAYPGASSSEVEKLITNPIEQKLKGINGIKKMTSVSIENLSSVVLQLDPDQTTDEEARRNIQDALDSIINLPSNAKEPKIKVVDSKVTPTIEISLSSNLSETQMRKQINLLEEKLENLPGVAKVEKKGYRKQEIKVSADLKKMQNFQISLQELINALGTQNKSIPGGTLNSSDSGEEILIRTVGDFLNIDDIGKTIVRANALGQAIRVKDIATVKIGFEKAKIYHRSNGKNSMNLIVFKQTGADAIDLVDIVKKTVSDTKNQLDKTISINYINDLSYYIRRRLNVLSNNMLIGLFFVLLILSLILPYKVAIITAIGIPFSFFAAILYFLGTGVSLNLLTMMGLIIVIGMLVDDAVVVTENIQRYREKGLSAIDAAIKGAQQIWAPVTASVMTTIIAFTPMLFMSGIMGKFVKLIPLGVIAALLFSLYECFFILPHHLARWISDKDLKKSRKKPLTIYWDNTIIPMYGKLVEKILLKRYLVSGSAFIVFIATIFLATKMSFILFPASGIEIFQVQFEAPIGTTAKKVIKLISPIETALTKFSKKEVKDFTTQIGIQQSNPSDLNTKRGYEYGQVNVYLTPATSRSRSSFEIIEELKKHVSKSVEGLKKINYVQQKGGPPVGKPVSLGVRGKSYKDIINAVNSAKKFLKTINGVLEVDDTYLVGKSELQIKINPVEAAAASLSLTSIGNTVRAAYEGVVATSIRKLDEEIDIRVLLAGWEQNSEKSLMSLPIPNLQGNLIPLNRLAHLKKSKGIALYEHENNKRQIRVTAKINEKITTSTAVNKLLLKHLKKLKKQHPKVSYFFGGEGKDSKESMQSLAKAFLFAAFGILMILILTFKSVLQSFLILFTTIPLGIMAVIWTFYLHGRPLTFLGLLGIVALSGVIVNNAIVLVSFINEERSAGVSNTESIINAAKMRLRPIFLTTVTTVVGILPTAYGLGGLDPFVVPIALGLGWGVFFGAFLTTMIFPASLAVLDDIQSFVKKKFA